MFTDHSTNRDFLLTYREVEQRTGLSRSTIYRKIRDGTFPRAAAKVGPRGVRWLERDITAWIQSCLDARDVTPTKPKPQK